MADWSIVSWQVRNVNTSLMMSSTVYIIFTEA